MLNQFSRTELLIGKEAMQRLYGARVAVFGIGGVGGYVVEALARSGVGAFDLIDDDKVCLTNINRQIIATRKTIGKYKVDVMEERVHSINPEAQVTVHKCFYLPETADQFDFTQYDYVVDAVDTVTAQLEIIMRAKEAAPPELVSDISEHGIILAGGGSKIFGMDKLIMDKIGVPVVNIKNPDQVVATGAGTAHYYIKDGRTLEE